MNRAQRLGWDHRPLLPGEPDARAVDIAFLDRDGTLNIHAPGFRTAADLVLVDGAVGAVRRLNEASIPVVLVTNQRGIATGALTWEELDGAHAVLMAALADGGAHLDDIRICPHDAGECRCRKPHPGLLLAALAASPWARPQRCVMVGDAESDRAAARAAGVPFEQVGTNRPVGDAVSDILAVERSSGEH